MVTRGFQTPKTTIIFDEQIFFLWKDQNHSQSHFKLWFRHTRTNNIWSQCHSHSRSQSWERVNNDFQKSFVCFRKLGILCMIFLGKFYGTLIILFCPYWSLTYLVHCLLSLYKKALLEHSSKWGFGKTWEARLTHKSYRSCVRGVSYRESMDYDQVIHLKG